MAAAIIDQLLPSAKSYARIDYEDDDELVKDMIGATLQSMEEVIPGFKLDSLTARQKILVYTTVKNLYDEREEYSKDRRQLTAAAASMLNSEIYEAMAKGAATNDGSIRTS